MDIYEANVVGTRDVVPDTEENRDYHDYRTKTMQQEILKAIGTKMEPGVFYAVKLKLRCLKIKCSLQATREALKFLKIKLPDVP